MLFFYHNPRCSKSREALDLLRMEDVDLMIVEYLIDPPNEKELAGIIRRMKGGAEDLIRKEETLYKEEFKGKDMTEAEMIKMMCDNPILIQRPLVFSNSKAVVGRPPEKVMELI